MTDETSTKNDPTLAQEKKRESFIGPTFVEFYANSCEAAMSQWDIQLTFGRNDDTQSVQRDQKLAKIYLSPMHAKAVSNVLAAIVKQYEKQFGELKLPGELVEKPAKPEAKP